VNLVKGDSKSLFIAAASILAKTARDEDCLRLEREYPGYGFAVHKGYPTKDHVAALERLGPCPEHRCSFGPVAKLLRADDDLYSRLAHGEQPGGVPVGKAEASVGAGEPD